MIPFIISVIGLSAFFGFCYAMDLKKEKRQGERWYQESEAFAFGNDKRIITENETVTEIYEKEMGTYKLVKVKNNDDWKISFYYQQYEKPYLTYNFDPKEKMIKDENYDKQCFPKYAGLSALERLKAIRNIQSSVNQYILDVYGDKGKSSRIQQIQNDKYEFVTDVSMFHPTRNGIKLSNNDAYYINEEEGNEKIIYWGNDGNSYTVTRDMETGNIISLNIDTNWLKDIDDVQEFAQKEEEVWNQIKEEMQKQKEKKEKLIQVWEKRETDDADEWRGIKRKIMQIAESHYLEKGHLSMENVFYLQYTLPKRMELLDQLREKTKTELGKKQLRMSQENIIKRLEIIQEEIDKNGEKEGNKMQQITVLETETII